MGVSASLGGSTSLVIAISVATVDCRLAGLARRPWGSVAISERPEHRAEQQPLIERSWAGDGAEGVTLF